MLVKRWLVVKRNFSMAEGGGKEVEADLIGGYEKRWFIKRQRVLEFLCGQCNSVFRDPQQIVGCGHQVCRSCLPNEVKECPICHIDVNPNEVFPDVSARKKVNELQMRCRSKPCKWKGTLKEFEEKHKNECPFQPVKCDNAACNDMVTKEDLVAHLRDECQYRKVACRHCRNEIIIADEKTHHEKDCLLIPVDCPNECGNEILREQVKNHVDNECERTLIDCTFTTVGCEAKVERATLVEHEKTMMTEHLSQALLAINNLRQEREAMEEKIAKLQEENNKLTDELRDSSEKEETRANEIESGLNEFKEQGILRVEKVEETTEKNFESLTQVVQQSGELQTTLLCIEHQLVTLRDIMIPALQANWNTNQTNNKKSAEKIVVAVYNKLSNAIASLRHEMDSKLDTLRTAHEEERTELLKYKEGTGKEILQLSENISKNASGLEKQNKALTETKHEMKKKFQDHSKQMQLDYDNLYHLITKEKQNMKNDLEQLKEEITDLQLNSTDTGGLLWRVDNVEAVLSKVNTKAKNVCRYGKAFYSEPHGYVVQPKIFFNGARHDDQGFVSILIRILKGKFDPILKWPFQKHIRFTLIEQESKGFKRDLQKVLNPDINADEFRRPTEEANNGIGIYKFVSHEVLRAGRYIVDDVMFLKIEVLENIERNGHSETM